MIIGLKKMNELSKGNFTMANELSVHEKCLA